MKSTFQPLSCVLIAAFGSPGLTVAAEAQRDLATETRAIFSAKCAGCHGPNLDKPKGRFGYVLDLARVAANREMVVPSAPEESELWQLISRDEMPPPESSKGPLSPEQKEVIRAWIASGAPNVASSQTSVSRSQTTVLAPLPPEFHDDPVLQEVSFVKHVLSALGALHILIVHFPIALLIAAAAGEFWAAWRGGRVPTPAVRFCVLLGAASAVAAAALGWLHAWNGYGAGTPRILDLHRWIGTTTALWAIGTALFSEWEERHGVRSRWFRAWLLFGALLVAVAAHFGGILVHGPDFLTGG